MEVLELMTSDPATCRPETSLAEVARLLVENDCGAIPVVDAAGRPVGIVTDRDIVVRCVAEGKSPLERTARDCMTSGTVTVAPGTDVKECLELMRGHQIRRIPVVDESGRCVGIVSQADVALEAGDKRAAAVLKDVSRPGSGALAHH